MEIDREDEHCKEVYAHAGLALYLAQVLEHGVVNASVAARMPERETITRADIMAFETEQFAKTLGGMLRAMRRYVTVPPEVETLLTEALRRRNYLAHHFFRKFAVQFMTAQGRDEMLAWLHETKDMFQRADKALFQLMAPIREQFGITDEAIAKVVAEMPTDLK